MTKGWSEAEWREKLAAARAGDRVAREELIQANLGLVRKVARRWRSGPEGEELFQVGCIGLWKAVERYNPDYGTAFSTYAVALILGEMRRHLRDNAAQAAGGRWGVAEAGRIRAATDALRQDLGREPTVVEVAGSLGVSVAELAAGLEAEAGATPLALLPEEGRAGVGEEAPWQERSLLRAMVGELESPARELIRWRYFGDRTQRETGTRLGLSQVQVSRLEKKILEKLRRSLMS